MSNIFIRTNIAPYRVDTYNALHERLDMTMCFYRREGSAQKFDVDLLESKCSFKPVYLRGITLGRDTRKWCFGLWRLLRKEKPSLVIVPEFQISAVQVLLYRMLTRRRFKVVSMVDDSYDMISNGNDFTKLHARLRNIFPKYLDDVIVVTPEVQKWYQDRYRKGIWLPIIPDDKAASADYGRLIPLSRQTAERYGLAGKRVLLSVGRLVDLKNLNRVIEAFCKCDCGDVLVFVGDGPELERLKEQAGGSGKEIIFPGRFDGDELYAWYNLASVFILASYKEPFGAVTPEALAAGCRVVISRNAGSSCLVDGTNGEVVDPYDVPAMAEAIDRQMKEGPAPDLAAARQSLMTVSFEERINNLVERVNSI